MGLLLALTAVPAAAEVILPQPTSETHYRLGVLSGGDMAVGGGSVLLGNLHANGSVRLGGGSRVDGDVSATDRIQTQPRSTVSGELVEGAAELPIPTFNEDELRAQADRVVEGNLVLKDAVLDEILFISGTVRIQGALTGSGALVASRDIRWNGPGGQGSGTPSEISLVAGRDLHLGSGRSLRGVLFAGRTAHLAQALTFEGVIVGGQRVNLGRNSSVTFVDFDQTPPTVTGLTPPDGGIVPTAKTEVSADFTDDLSGVDPETVVLEVDGIDRTAAATVTTDGIVLPAGEVMGEGSHTVELSLADRSANQTSTSWAFVVDTVPPTLAITEPSPPLVIDDPAPQIALAFSDATSGVDPATLEVAIDGTSITESCTVTGSEALCASPELPFGVHTAVGEIRDRAGHQATATLTYETREDLSPPELSLTTPGDGDFLSSGTVQVSGTARDDGILVSVRVNGREIEVSDGSFQTTLELSEGADIIQAVAEDSTGKETLAAVLVTVDTIPPVLTVETPEDGSFRNSSTVVVSGRVADASPIASLTVGGESTPLDGDRFQRELTLQPGSNLVAVEATDRAGHVARQEVAVELFHLPEVRITAPADLATLTTTTVSVHGVLDNALDEVEVNDVPATVLADGSFVAEGVPLAEGGNVLTATVRTSDGAVNTASIHVVRDLTPPRVEITSPADGDVVRTGSISVSGLVNDIVAGTVNSDEATVTVNGVPAQVTNRNFLAENVPLDPGDNLLVAQAVDASGNVGQGVARVLQESTPDSAILESIAGDLQRGPIRQELAESLQVVVRAADGTPLPGRTVIFEEESGGGHLEGERRRVAVVTDGQGLASARWTLGRRAGVQRVRTSAVGVPGSLTFTALASAADARFIVVDAGDQQVGLAGQRLPRPFIATVTDEGFNRLEGVPVEWNVVKGEGHFGAGEQSLVVETDSDGRAVTNLVLGPGEGVANNAVTARILELEESPTASFTASGKTAGPAEATAVTGVVLDNTSRPVAGVTVRIDGTSLLAETDAAGQFRIDGAPVGEIHLIVDGSTADRPGVWASLEFRLTTIPGRDNDLGMPIFILPLDVGEGLFVDETTGGILTVPDVPGLSLEVAPGSVTFPGGSKSGVVSMTVVHSDRVPMVPNFGQQPRLIITIQPAGARFDPPAKITYPNVEGLAPGETTDLYSFDHDLGHFVSIGPGTVSDDGTVLVSDPGVGILKAGWQCGGDPQSATGTPFRCDECETCDGTACLDDPAKDGTNCGDEPGMVCKDGECVCPVPVNFRLLEGAGCRDIDNAVLECTYEWSSSTGNLGDLAKCDVREVVKYPSEENPFEWPSPPWASQTSRNPTRNTISGSDGGLQDFHFSGVVQSPPTEGGFVAAQRYEYSCPCQNGGEWQALRGPLLITRRVKRSESEEDFVQEVCKEGVCASRIEE